jgi:hypothetical protein
MPGLKQKSSCDCSRVRGRNNVKNNNVRVLRSGNVKTAIILLVLLPGIELIGGLPWWGFVVPVIALGIVIAWQSWHVAAFSVGFVCGFITWLTANWYFDMHSNSVLLSRVGVLFSVGKAVLLLASGVIGGVLTGLALFTGKAFLSKRERRPISFNL